MPRRPRPRRFSVVKAVKSNARDRIGSPPPQRVLPDARFRAASRPERFRPTLEQTLARAREDESKG